MGLMSSVGSVLTNEAALNALNSIAKSAAAQNNATTQLSTGLAISEPYDNPAGYITAQGMTSEIGGITQAMTNANTGISLTQTATSAIQQQISISQNLYSIALQAANGTKTSSNRQSLQGVVEKLVREINDISQTTQFNGQNLLDGSFRNVQFQTGAENGQAEDLSIGSTSANQLGTAFTHYQSVLDPTGQFDTSLNPGVAISSGLGISSLTSTEYTSGTVSIKGSTGSVNINVVASESANTLAASINAVSSATGVSASAKTAFQVKLGSGGHGLYTISYHTDPGNIIGGGYTHHLANVTAAQMVSQINSQTAVSGLSVSMNSSGVLSFLQASGMNVEFYGNASNNSFNFFTASGAPFPNKAGQNDIVYTGETTLTSADPFTLTNGQNIGLLNKSASGSYLSSMNVTTQSGAESALKVVQTAISQLENQAANIGAFQDGLQVLSNNLSTTSSNAQSALGIIQDANIPEQTNILSSSEIQDQAGVAALRNSTALQESFLSLLP
jgi:flagellin